MRCQDVKLALAAQRDDELAQSDVLLLREHLKQCPACRAYQQRLQCLDRLFRTATSYEQSRISTERIMLAVQQQKRITQQLEDIRMQQRSRIAQLRIVGPLLAVVAMLALGSVPVLLFTLAIVQPDLMVKTLTLLSDGVGALIVFAQYLQAGLTLVTRNSWLLSPTAFVLVVMMGMWLRLMRHPQEA
jgi:predicted anti-sigma-YlaC factor YlaD